MLLALVAGIALMMASTMLGDSTLLLLGAVPGRWRGLFLLPWALLALATSMMAAIWAMWSGCQRSVLVQIY